VAQRGGWRGVRTAVGGLFSRILAPLNRLGVRGRLFLYFLLFTAALLTLLWVFQIALLPDFYRFQKTRMLARTIDTLEQNIDNQDLQLLADRIAEANEVSVLVTDEQAQRIVSSDAVRSDGLNRMNGMDYNLYIQQTRNSGKTIYLENSQGEQQNNGYDENRFSGPVPPASKGLSSSMTAIRRVETETGEARYIFLNVTITPVEATVQTIGSQYLFIACFMVLLSFVLSLVLSRRIAQPIVDTTEAAVGLSEGRFLPATTSVSYREVMRLNATLTKAARDLRRVETMQRELIANISHDLRTPLTLIEGYAEAMRDLPGENTPENMQVIIEETRRLTSLVNAVLEYSAGAGGDAIDPQTYNLTRSIRVILDRYQKLTGLDGYKILFSADRDALVTADEMKIGQVIYNLINNALTYTGEDKTVTVRQIASAGTVRVEVSDTGNGIAPEELAHIWSRYYRGQKPHKRAAVGTGLGLSIVKGILDAHKLRYGVESPPGCGATFWFELPETQADEP
jgi:signal transduction histidine kinase